MRYGLLLPIVGLLACGASATRVNGPDGSGEWYSITCRRTRANCLEKAGEVCPKGYQTANASEKQSLFMMASTTGGSAGQAYDGQMLVKCREGAEP